MAGSGGAERAGGTDAPGAEANALPAGTAPDAGNALAEGTMSEIGKVLEAGGLEDEKADAGGFEDEKARSEHGRNE